MPRSLVPVTKATLPANRPPLAESAAEEDG
jgi:hypothetical protein